MQQGLIHAIMSESAFRGNEVFTFQLSPFVVSLPTRSNNMKEEDDISMEVHCFEAGAGDAAFSVKARSSAQEFHSCKAFYLRLYISRGTSVASCQPYELLQFTDFK